MQLRKYLLWQQSERLRLLPQSQGSSALTSSWKSDVSSTRLQAISICLPPHTSAHSAIRNTQSILEQCVSLPPVVYSVALEGCVPSTSSPGAQVSRGCGSLT